ncbi:hypothetical protein FO440_23910 [Mucilaginibacter corticis]|uniref:AlgX/AlgJ SGNH hydrolase-like domain-containing protein n=1 Tax=Mucilaginibacter corticis TaxID=2597670 RepID=A0A556M851_9SPHI|nr:hypothetical protein [Mucilaginibacter corticis]TSJ35966.1 hypothetical protein FO440_23910 [Mucilaginibacter corticis]
MRKTICLFLLISGVALLYLAMNQTLINKIKQDRYFDHLNPPAAYNKTLYYRMFVRSDRWRYGDLYGLCYLPWFKANLEPFKKYGYNNRQKLTNRILYITGDSFLADKTMEGAFNGFDNVVFLDQRFPYGPIALDSSKENYLIMEFTERRLNGFDFYKTDEAKWAKAEISAKLNYSKRTAPGTDSKLPATIWERINNAFFNKDLSRNLALLLFDDRIFTPVKELKATLNYRLLGWLPQEVAISTDEKRLLLNITVDSSYQQSAFKNISGSQLDQINQNLMAARSYYESIGFKKVFLSLIPNPVSIYDAKRMPYNHLLERVEKKTNLTVIPLYNTFKSYPGNLYYRNDAHWNPNGFDIWISKTNEILNAGN